MLTIQLNTTLIAWFQIETDLCFDKIYSNGKICLDACKSVSVGLFVSVFPV